MERDRIIELLGTERPLSRDKRTVLDAGAAAIPGLISILCDEELGDEAHPTGGWAPIHAATLLGELHAEAAIAPMLELLANTEWNAIVHDKLILALPKIGPAVIEPALQAYAAAADEDVRGSLASVLAEFRGDERIYRLLVERFEAGLDETGLELAAHGDRRALPLLQRAYDAFQIVEDDDARFANRDLIDLRDHILELGGTLSVEQEAKFEIAMAPTAPNQGPAVRVERPGRNEPCWCRSGLKYKKCHLATDELVASK